MLASYQKSEILNSLELMSASQRDKVLQYMRGLLEREKAPKEAVRSRALREIQLALRENNF